jgi:hypothetical protein
LVRPRAGSDRAEFAAPAPQDHGDAVLVVDELLDPAGPEQLPLPAGGAVEVEHGFLLTVMVGCCTATSGDRQAQRQPLRWS